MKVKNKKKVLIISFTFFPELNGVANVALSHARFLMSSGYDVEIITSGGGDTLTSDLLGDVKITRFSIKGSFKIHDLIRGELFKCIKYINNLEVDTIYCHAWESWSTDICLFLKSQQSKVVIFSHGVSYKSKFSRFPLLRKLLLLPYRIIVPYLIRKVNKVVLLSDTRDNDRFYDASLIYKNHPSGKIFILPNFCPNFDYDYISSVELNFKLPSDYYVCVSNYQPLKNQEQLITLVSKIPTIKLVLVGGGCSNYYHYLVELANKLGISERVFFLTELSHDESMAVLSKAKAFLLSSKTECFPLCVLESISLDVPVISRNVGCLGNIDGLTTYEKLSDLVRIINEIESDSNYLNFLKKDVEYIRETYSENVVKKALVKFTGAVTNDKS